MRKELDTYRIPPGGLVFIGGMFGALIRGILDALNGTANFFGIDLSTIFVNVLGAFFMGMLVTTWVAMRGFDPRWDRIKILLGTGFLGAFTTYSTFALAIAQGVKGGTALAAFEAGALVIIAGVVGVALGVAIAPKKRSDQ